jgi:pSer/pThr/pTyr-binding forkhead associated (FHA) protein
VSGAGAGLQLEVLAGNASGTLIAVEERLVFGRQADGQGQLGNDPELSRHHAEIARLPAGGYQLEDLSSTNGTFVNGQKIAAPAVLALGDVVELGTTKLVVRALPTAPTPEVDVRAATVTVDVPTEPVPAPPPPLELRLKVDLAAQEAEVALGGGQSVRFRLHDGRWQIADGDSR